MNSAGWERLLLTWSKIYYTNFFLFACLIICLVICVRFRQRGSTYLQFVLYIFFALLVFVFFELLLFGIFKLTRRQFASYVEANNMLLSVIEFIVFYNFFRSILESKKVKVFMALGVPIIVAFASSFIMKVAGTTFSAMDISHHSELTSSFNFLFLGTLCIFYYHELLRKKPVFSLSQSPAFWIVLGLFFYCFISLPFFLIGELIMQNFNKIYTTFYAIHYIFFGLLFLAIGKAMLLRKPLVS